MHKFLFINCLLSCFTMFIQFTFAVIVICLAYVVSCYFFYCIFLILLSSLIRAAKQQHCPATYPSRFSYVGNDWGSRHQEAMALALGVLVCCWLVVVWFPHGQLCVCLLLAVVRRPFLYCFGHLRPFSLLNIMMCSSPTLSRKKRSLCAYCLVSQWWQFPYYV